MDEWNKVYDGPLEEPAEAWFVNRKRELEILWKRVSNVPNPGPKRSFALIGLRRTGKTALMHKLFNRLFHEQDEIIPVYISFAQYLNRSEPITAIQFAKIFFKGYIGSYLAFKYDLPYLLKEKIDIDDLRIIVSERADEFVPELLRRYDQAVKSRRDPDLYAHSLAQLALDMPRGQAWSKKIPTALFIDEFQVLTNVYDPGQDLYLNLCHSFQTTAESKWSPLLVSGSSVSMLVGEALSGMLSGRFQHLNTGPLEANHAIEMIFRMGTHLNIPITDELAETIYETTLGYPYSIESILFSASSAVAELPDLDAVETIVSFELNEVHGALGRHYKDEYGKYVSELNGDKITRKILYWITNQPGTPEEPTDLHPRHIARTLGLEYAEVADSLKRLYQIDVIQHQVSTTYWGPTDPLLRHYLQYAHYRDVEDLTPKDAAAKLRRELNRKQGEINRKVGHFTEIIVAGLLKQYDGRTVAGDLYFGITGEIKLPRAQQILRREGVVKKGHVHEIDLISEYRLYNRQEDNAGLGVWMVSVRYREERMGIKAIQEFIRDVDIVQQEKQYGKVTRWYFSQSGFTIEAVEFLQKEGVYFSDLARFNKLTDLFDVMNLSV